MRFFFLLVICSFLSIKGDCYQDALQRLLEGNQRFVRGELTYPQLILDARERLRESQEPFAAILACSDSRVSPELIFDQGLGDLFVVRIAGNIADSTELESLNYAVLYLHSSIVMVLGHQNCGAVSEVLNGRGSELPEIAGWIEPALETKGDKELTLEEAVKRNVQEVVAYLKTTNAIAELIKQKKIEVVGGYYHLDTGVVEVLTQTEQ